MGTVVAPIGGFDALIGIDPPAFDKMSGGFIFDEGHTFQSPDDLLIDAWYADQRKVRAGSKLNILGHDWHVAGIVEPGKLGHLFVQMGPLQDLQGGAGKVSQIFLKLDSPSNVDSVIEYLKKKDDSFNVLSMAELESLISVDHIPLLTPFLHAVLGIAVVIAFLVVLMSMYMAVLQRTREIGILKSLGAANSLVMSLILAEALVMGFCGTILGIALTYATQYAIHRVMPASLPQAVVYIWWPIAGSSQSGQRCWARFTPESLRSGRIRLRRSHMNDPIIRIRDLRKVYQMGKVLVEALRGVNLEVPKGEFLSIVGPSGSGKSTLFHIVGGLTPPSGGEVIVAGMDVSKVGNSAGRSCAASTSASYSRNSTFFRI